MAESFLGEIRIFAATYAPYNWSFCDGQVLAASQQAALFSLLGSYYGGDGRTTFALPDMRGRLPLHFGQGPGLTPYPIGARVGVESVTLTMENMPRHTHTLMASNDAVTTDIFPANQVTGVTDPTAPFYTTTGNITSLASESVGYAGGTSNQQTYPHSLMMPYLALNFIISLKGTYPSRN
ncbi:tail fiber protein [Hahella aquimaris]|uniref:phage tail protein n=1 Tax=Hahella sp. HNIBRBA332 TaxID=3015983 RepID=UPI00273B6B25|nr:tail fiber protein [Hahella sp. HNIBRBA332]WLQ13949.1 tail fiber protein [Hahella sp. HNIBRBA332]